MASLIMYKLLATLGYRKTFAIYSAIDAVVFAVALMLVKERRPACKRPEIVWVDRSFFQDPVFWSLGMCFLFTVLWVMSAPSDGVSSDRLPPVDICRRYSSCPRTCSISSRGRATL